LLHPRSRVQKCTKENAHEHTGTVGAFRRPCAMVLRLMPRSPRRRIRLVTVIGELAARLRPVGPTCLRRFSTSNGCQDHTVLPYALASLVWHDDDRSRQAALQSIFTHDATASTASRPSVRDDGQRPSSRDRTAQLIVLICPTRLAEYFCKADWTGQITLIRLNKSTLSRNEIVAGSMGTWPDSSGPRVGHTDRRTGGRVKCTVISMTTLSARTGPERVA
jgi:hypothetical protein